MPFRVYYILLLAMAAPAPAQFTYPGCGALQAGDFHITEVAGSGGLQGVMQMDFTPVVAGDTAARIDIWFVERLGAVKHYSAATGLVGEAGRIPVWGEIDNGLMGIALHPDFARNRWLYLWICPAPPAPGANRRLKLSRFTVTSGNRLDMASEKVLLDILGSKVPDYHNGGPMTFDAYGDLWITVGNNSQDINEGSQFSPTDSSKSAEWGSSNTASLRGGILRIHPDSSARGYRVPPGNFGEYWATRFESQGRAALAAQYRDTGKVRPEVYVKGSRSNWSLTVHPRKRWLGWAEVNYGSSWDEFNITAHPVFGGFPYFHGNNERTPGGNHDPAAPRNTSPLNSGVADLPPAMPGTLNNLVNVAITGPIHVFDPALLAAGRFPPHLHHTWMTMGFTSGQMWIHALDSQSLAVTRTERVDNGLFKGLGLRYPVQARYGPDGALYVLNYGGSGYSNYRGSVTRIGYYGNCRPVSAVEPPPMAFVPAPKLTLRREGLVWEIPAGRRVGFFSLQGKRLPPPRERFGFR